MSGLIRRAAMIGAQAGVGGPVDPTPSAFATNLLSLASGEPAAAAGMHVRPLAGETGAQAVVTEIMGDPSANVYTGDGGPIAMNSVDRLQVVYDDTMGVDVFEFTNLLTDDAVTGSPPPDDRSRCEIKTPTAAIAAALPVTDDRYRWTWLMKIPVGFVSSATRFCHIAQLKTRNNPNSPQPISTVGIKNNEIHISCFRSGGTVATSPIAGWEGEWVYMDRYVQFSESGSGGEYGITCTRVSDLVKLIDYPVTTNDMNDPGMSGGVDQHWGVYRYTQNESLLRNEAVRYADFKSWKL